MGAIRAIVNNATSDGVLPSTVGGSSGDVLKLDASLTPGWSPDVGGVGTYPGDLYVNAVDDDNVELKQVSDDASVGFLQKTVSPYIP